MVLAMSLVETISVWYACATSGRLGMQHCTSMIIISTAPVTIASSCCRKLPATGMPWRMRISLAVQQMPARVMPSAPAAFAYCDDLRILHGDGQHLGERRLMAVDEDVDRVFAQHAEVGRAPDRRGRAEEDVRDDGGHARAAPAVGQRGAEGVHQEVPVVMVHAHCGAVQGLHHHAVDAQRLDVLGFPDALPLDGRELQVSSAVLPAR